MKWLAARGTFGRLLVAAALVTAITSAAAGWSLSSGDPLRPWMTVIGALLGAVPWPVVALLRPRLLAARQLRRWMEVAAALASVPGAAGLAWSAFLVMNADSEDPLLVLVPLAAIAVAGVAAVASRSIAWLPLAVALLSLVGGAVWMISLGFWTASCPDCPTHQYHDPPTRQIMLSAWVVTGVVAASLYAGMLVLFTYTVRFVSGPRA